MATRREVSATAEARRDRDHAARAQALEAALRTHGAIDGVKPKDDEVVKTAKKYHAFLKVPN